MALLFAPAGMVDDEGPTGTKYPPDLPQIEIDFRQFDVDECPEGPDEIDRRVSDWKRLPVVDEEAHLRTIVIG